MAGGIGHRRAADKAVGPVDDDVILVAEHRDRDVGHAPLRPGGVLAPPGLHRPPRIRVLLRRLGRLIGPDLGRALARPLLVIAVALLGRRYQRRIDDLPAHRQIAAPAQLAIEGGKQIIPRPGPDQTLARAPYGVAVRRRRTEIEAQEAKPPVRLVEIPKDGGGVRPLGIPTIADRVAQTVVKMVLEPVVEPEFHSDSYGYRPGRSALDAVGVARKRCWEFDWVIDLDIKAYLEVASYCPLVYADRSNKLG